MSICLFAPILAKLKAVEVSGGSVIISGGSGSGGGSSGEGGIGEDNSGGSSGGGIPVIGGGDWKNCTKASCWSGNNARQRHMNLLSPKYSEKTFKDRIDWALKRGCNCVHFFVTNQGDQSSEEKTAGYSIWGGTPNFGKLSLTSVNLFKSRCEYCIEKSLLVVLWLMADDSGSWDKKMLNNPEKFAEDMKNSGLLKYASTVVLGLELNEYAKSTQVKNLSNAFRNVYSGKLGVHHGSGHADFIDYADILFYQINPTNNSNTVKNAVKKALSYGKPVNMFELYREPNRKMSQVALDVGAFGVGNW